MEPSRFFDAVARRYDRVYALSGPASKGRMARVLAELPRAARVLDLGVGTGRELSALLDAGHSPVGLDASAEMLALCARRARPVPLVLADFWGPLPFDDGSFDAAIALHGALAHPPSDGALDTLASELGRVLGPGGVFVAEVPSPPWLDTIGADGAADDLGRRLQRVGVDRVLYEDLVAGARIEGRVFDEGRWRRTLEGRFFVQIEPLGGYEYFIVARRR